MIFPFWNDLVLLPQSQLNWSDYSCSPAVVSCWLPRVRKEMQTRNHWGTATLTPSAVYREALCVSGGRWKPFKIFSPLFFFPSWCYLLSEVFLGGQYSPCPTSLEGWSGLVLEEPTDTPPPRFLSVSLIEHRLPGYIVSWDYNYFFCCDISPSRGLASLGSHIKMMPFWIEEEYSERGNNSSGAGLAQKAGETFGFVVSLSIPANFSCFCPFHLLECFHC